MALFSRMMLKRASLLHIKDFARPGPRPIIGCALEYLVILDERGRFRAQQVTYLKASQTRKALKHAKHNLLFRPAHGQQCKWGLCFISS